MLLVLSTNSALHQWPDIKQRVRQTLYSAWVQTAACACVGAKVKSKTSPFQRKSRFASKGDEAREVLANTLLNHIPVIRYNFQAKVCSTQLTSDVYSWPVNKETTSFVSTARMFGMLTDTVALSLWCLMHYNVLFVHLHYQLYCGRNWWH